ncbi:MAG: polysaccharide deacetylase family protein [Deltaproteobacteria bacterium]|nr:polysaccharide deacetylase family protein [Deltaproteobacteria bacterium]
MAGSQNCFTIDVEDWFHILDNPASPKIDDWASLESRVDVGVNWLLELLDRYSVKATMFWLGWIAERNKSLLRRCVKAGHEIASHGYGHVLAYEVGSKAFFEDARRGKAVLEDITGCEVKGFRAAGFSTRDDTHWTFEKVALAGYSYDSSVFPASRGHGGAPNSKLEPFVVDTKAGKLVELPQSVIEVCGKRISLFGGGYLRLVPKWLIKLGVRRLRQASRPLIVYVHPREVDPNHPRLPLPLFRRFKCYVNLKSTLAKLEWICDNHVFVTMRELAHDVRYYTPPEPPGVSPPIC